MDRGDGEEDDHRAFVVPGSMLLLILFGCTIRPLVLLLLVPVVCIVVLLLPSDE